MFDPQALLAALSEMSANSPHFFLFNDNPSQCSAWMKSENRCCRRQISAPDMKRRAMLLSTYKNQILQSSSQTELAGLYFCNGWHRPGGKYPVQSSARDTVLSLLQESAGPATRFHTRGRPVPSTADNVEESASICVSINLSEEERLRFSGEHSSGQHQGRASHLPPLPPATRQHRQPAPSSAGSVREADPRDAPRSSFANEDLTERLAEHTPAPLAVDLLQRRTQQGIPTGNTGNRRSARLQAQQHASPILASTARSQPASVQREEPQATPVSVRRSARLQAQQHAARIQGPTARSEPAPLQREEPRLPAQRFAEAPADRVDPRLDRIVDVNGECPICTCRLGPLERVARCNHCCNDYHLDCVLMWFNNATTAPSCGIW